MTIFGSFVVLCLVVAVTVVLLRSHLETAADAQTARAQVISGTLLVRERGQEGWISATPDIPLSPGSRVHTDELSQAFLVLFDHSTLRLYPETEIEVTELSSSRFGPRRDTIQLTVIQGRMHVGVAPPVESSKLMRILTPHGSADLEDGAYTVDVHGDRTQLRVAERGQALLYSEGATFSLQSGERIVVGPQFRSGPTQAREELVVNGNLAYGLQGWQSGNYLGFPEGTDVVAQQGITLDEGRVAVRFRRVGSKGTHNETYLYQDVERDVAGLSELYLSLDVKLQHHDLSGGGYLGTEYPVIVRVRYRGANADNSVVYGFYYQNTTNNRTDFGAQIPRDTWVSYTTTENLMTLNPRPQRILSVQVGASGWDYDSLVANISLAGR